MIEDRRIYLDWDETHKLQEGKSINREIRGDHVGQVYQLKIIPKRMDFSPRPFVGRPMSDKDYELIDE